MSRSSAIQDVLEQTLRIPNTTIEMTHTGDYASVKSIGLRYARRSNVFYGEKTTWVVSPPSGESVDVPESLSITRIDNDTLQAVTRITNTVISAETAWQSGLRRWLDNFMVVRNEELISAHVTALGYIRGIGMEGTSLNAWEYNISGDFPPPSNFTTAEDINFAVLDGGDGYITVIVLKSWWVKSTNMIHERMRKYKFSASGGLVGNTIMHDKVFQQLGDQVNPTEPYYASLERVSPSYYLYSPSGHETSDPPPEGTIQVHPRIYTYIRHARTDATIHTDVFNHTFVWARMEFRPTISENNNFLNNSRPFISDNERPLLGGRFIGMTRGNITSDNGYRFLWERASGGIGNIVIPYFGGSYSNQVEPYIVLGISPDDDIYMVWRDRRSGYTDTILRKFDSGGNLEWEVREDAWNYNGWSILIENPLYAMIAASGTSEDLLYFNTRCHFNTLGQPVLTGTYLPPTSTGRAPYTRVVLDPKTGKPKTKPNQASIPNISGKIGLGLGSFMSYNAVTDSAQEMFLIANTQSTAPISDSAFLGKFRRMAIEQVLQLRIIVKNASTGEPLNPYDYDIRLEVDGYSEWPSYDYDGKFHYLNVQPGQEWEATISSNKYEKKQLSGTIANKSQTVEALMQPKSWTRKQYEIYTPQDLFDMRDDPLGLYTIMNDLDMAGFPWETPFQGGNDAFMGSLDGQGYKIKNWVHNEASGFSYTGLAGATQNAVFKNIVFENCHFTGESGHGLSIVMGFSLNVPLFDPEREDIPPDYEELIAQFHNITFKQCTLGNRYGHSGAGFLFGDFVWSRPAPNEPVLDNIVVDRCKINGADYGSSNYGGIWGQASISIIEG